ncbi:MAG: SprT family zinc-dependent metalloprotease [Pseudomonadota bacterium]
MDGDPPIELELRANPRARRLTLRVAARDGRVTLTVPRGVGEREALDFAHSRRAWIGKHLASVQPERTLGLGDMIPVEGQDLRVAVGPVRSARIEAGDLLLPTRSGAAPGRAVAGFLKVLARERLAAASDRHAAVLGRRYARITLRDTRSRWGSCSSAGALMYSWRLAMAPPEVLSYVAAHEVAHLEEMNHSRAFWGVVERLMPEFEGHRRWLRENGTALQRIKLD